MNLQSNAIKFTEAGHVIIRVQIVKDLEGFANLTPNTKEDLFIRISVEDTGVGIKKKDQDKLFRLFGFVKDAEGANTHGIGLGLVISEKVVHQFGG